MVPIHGISYRVRTFVLPKHYSYLIAETQPGLVSAVIFLISVNRITEIRFIASTTATATDNITN